MALQNEVSNALYYATSKGFQIHPNAFAMLKSLDVDVLKIIQEIIKVKKPTKNTVIVVEDIKTLLEPKKQEGPVEQTCAVLIDPTPKVTTAEGVEGYTALFRSRFEKTMRILAQRPDSKRISKVSAVKQRVRISKQAERGEKSLHGAADSIIVAGLLMSKRNKKNDVELAIDDYTGILTAISTVDDVKKQASTLALDQMVMLELENGKARPGLTIKSVMMPDIP
ncbi:MAG: DNA polymerase II small subunit, partial [Thermoproteota archaeon]|nr:DNA polymerase II small subunit [Thermoproteota archaeon]